jgi:hypothetical protein
VIEYLVALALVGGPSLLWVLWAALPGGAFRIAAAGIAFVATQVATVLVSTAIRAKR